MLSINVATLRVEPTMLHCRVFSSGPEWTNQTLTIESSFQIFSFAVTVNSLICLEREDLSVECNL